VSSSTAICWSVSRARAADIPCEQGQTVMPVTRAPTASWMPSPVAVAEATMSAVD
jgi:hypothetical protein